MLATFPTCLFAFQSREFDIAQNVVSGGTSLAGAEDLIATDGGGFWFAEYQNAPLNTRPRVMAWRATRAQLDGGARPIVFPLCDARHQPVARKYTVPHDDDTPHDDETPYAQGDCEVLCAADAPLRATSMAIDIVALGKDLIGGEKFSIDHPTWRHRTYEIKSIEGNTIRFRPPLRETVAAGAALDFNDPKCVMRLDGQMSAPLQGPRFATGSIRLVEDMSGSYS